MKPYDVGPGWWAMLDEQVTKARALVPDVQHQEKEKYGRCDLYFWSEEIFGSSKELFEIEAEIERQSLKICEFCGRPGKLRENRSWMQTLCDRCAAINPIDRRRIAQEVAEQYFRGSHIRHGEPKSREEERTYTLDEAIKELGLTEGSNGVTEE